MDATQGCANMMVKGSVNLPCLLNQKGPGKVNCDPDMSRIFVSDAIHIQRTETRNLETLPLPGLPRY